MKSVIKKEKVEGKWAIDNTQMTIKHLHNDGIEYSGFLNKTWECLKCGETAPETVQILARTTGINEFVYNYRTRLEKLRTFYVDFNK